MAIIPYHEHTFVLPTADDDDVANGTPGKLVTADQLSHIATSGSASDLIVGTLPAARMPEPTVSTLGGVMALAAPTNEFVTGIGADGIPTTARPTTADVSGLAAVASSGAYGDLSDTPTLGTAAAQDIVGTVADAAVLTVAVGSIIETQGYTTPGDGGAARYQIVATDPGDDGAFAIGTKFASIIEPELRPEMFGAKGDGATADDTAFARALNASIARKRPLILRRDADYLITAAYVPPDSDATTIEMEGFRSRVTLSGLPLNSNGTGPWLAYAPNSATQRLKLSGIEFYASDPTANQTVFYLPSVDIEHLLADEVKIHNTRLDASVGMNGIPHAVLAKFRDIELALDAPGMTANPAMIQFRTGDYTSEVTEPRTDREPSLWIDGCYGDVHGQDGANVDLMKIDGLTKYAKFINNTIRNTNPASSLQIDFHPGGDGAIVTGNTMENIQILLKDDLGSFTDRGLTEATMNRHKVVMGNVLRFDTNFVGTFGIAILGSTQITMGNHVYAQRADASIEFSAFYIDKIDAGQTYYGNDTASRYNIVEGNFADITVLNNTGGKNVSMFKESNGKRYNSFGSNIGVGGNVSGIEPGGDDAATAESRPNTWLGNMWLAADNLASGDAVITAAGRVFQGNVAFKADGTLNTAWVAGVRSELNAGLGDPVAFASGTAGTSNTLNASSSLSYKITGNGSINQISGGSVGDVMEIIYGDDTGTDAPLVLNSYTTVFANHILLNGGSNITLSLTHYIVRLKKVANGSWVQI